MPVLKRSGLTLFIRFAFLLLLSCGLSADIRLIGADPSGSDDVAVPPWDGGFPKKDREGSHHINPYADERPLFIINSENYLQHKDRLSAGLIALLKQYPDTFSIPVYPSHRSANYPNWFYETMRKNHSDVALLENGNAIRNPIAGVNFPNPKSGLEAIWNHLARWRGIYVSRQVTEAIVYDDGKRRAFRAMQSASLELFRPSQEAITDKSALLYYYSKILEPVNLSGGALLVVDYLNQHKYPRQTWSYDASQRRVKRIPHVTHDSAALMVEGLRTADDTDMFNGSPERYDWDLVGKRIMYIPYNSYEFTSPAVSYDDLLTRYHPNPKYTRFEAHRVWEVVATLKSDAYHVYKKRVFYIDEDSWSIAIADQYDRHGKIWRISMAHLKNYYEVPLIFSTSEVYLDLKSKYYNVAGLTNEEKSSGDFSDTPPPKSYFSPAGLRSRLTR